jgi:NDP-sugar pyrophosphorylase family protein
MKAPARQFFELPDGSPLAKIFSLDESPLCWLSRIESAVDMLSTSGENMANFPKNCDIGERVFIHKSVRLPGVCVIHGPCYIGAGTEVRPFAHIRGSCIIGENCVIGHCTEVKGSILLNGVEVPHFNYVGDSILGNHSHLGAGVILANLRLDGKSVVIFDGEEKFDTNRRKFGAIVGDHASIGCNAVLNPGTVLPRHGKVYAGASVRGFIGEAGESFPPVNADQSLRR